MTRTFFNAVDVEKAGIEDCIFLYIMLKIALRAQPIDAQTVTSYLDCINS